MPLDVDEVQVGNALYASLVELRSIEHSKIDLTQATCNGHAEPVWFPARLREDEAATDAWRHVNEVHLPGVMAALPALNALLEPVRPTADAHDAASRAVDKHRERADFLVAQVDSVYRAITAFCRDGKPVDAILFLVEVASTLEASLNTDRKARQAMACPVPQQRRAGVLGPLNGALR